MGEEKKEKCGGERKNPKMKKEVRLWAEKKRGGSRNENCSARRGPITGETKTKKKTPVPQPKGRRNQNGEEGCGESKENHGPTVPNWNENWGGGTGKKKILEEEGRKKEKGKKKRTRGGPSPVWGKTKKKRKQRIGET